MRSSVLALAVPLLALPATAQAHFTLLAPPPASNSTNGGKGDPPCGPTDMPSNVVTPVMGGSKLTLSVSETVFHPGFYRIALSIKSRSELPIDNVVKDANGMVLSPAGPGTSASAEYETNPVFPVLADNLWPHTTAVKMFTAEVTLPNVNCDKCTLQVIEFMAQHGSNGPKAGYFYHHCADLKITADATKPLFDPTGGSGAGGGSSGGSSGTAGAGGKAAAPGGSGGVAGVVAGADNGGATGGTSAGTAGAASGVSGGGAAAVGLSGAPAIAGSAGAGVQSGAPGVSSPAADDDAGGCTVTNRGPGSKPWFALLVGLWALSRRRGRR